MKNTVRVILLALSFIAPLAAMKREAPPAKEEKTAQPSEKKLKTTAEQQTLLEILPPTIQEQINKTVLTQNIGAEFPNEIGVEILKQLVHVKVGGTSHEQRFYYTILNIRNFMKAFPQFYNDALTTNYIITELSKKYKKTLSEVAIALNTTSAQQWLKNYLEKHLNEKYYSDPEIRTLFNLFKQALKDENLGTARFIFNCFPPGTLLPTALFLKDLPTLQTLLTTFHVNVNEQDKAYERTVLINAIRMHCKLPLINFLLQTPGININLQDKKGWTALMAACDEDDPEITKRLLQVPGIEVNIKNNKGKTALILAAANVNYGGSDLIMPLLQTPGIDINTQDNNGDTALIEAAYSNHYEIIHELLKMPNIKVNMQNGWGDTALIIAARNSNAETLNELLKAPSIDVNIKDKDGDTALILAMTEAQHLQFIERLLQVPNINVNAQNRQGFSALMLAAHKGELPIVKRLLQIPGITINARANNRTALGLARASNHPTKEAIIKLLVAHGAVE